MKKTTQLSISIANSQNTFNILYNARISQAIKNNNPILLNKLTQEILMDNNIAHKGIILSQTQTMIQDGFRAGLLTDKSAFEPSNFFRDNGKVSPTEFDIRSPDLNKPITSQLEIIGLCLANKYIPNNKFQIARTSFSSDITHYQNNCNQPCGDYEAELTLDDGTKHYYRVDLKVTSFEQVEQNLTDIYKSQRFSCNIYLLGGNLDKKTVHSFKNSQLICNQYSNSGDPVAMHIAQRDHKILDTFDKTKLNSDLYTAVSTPKFMGVDLYKQWFDDLKDIVISES